MKNLLLAFFALGALAVACVLAAGLYAMQQVPAASAPPDAAIQPAPAVPVTLEPTPEPTPEPTSAPTETPAPTLAAIGETVSGGGVALTVNGVSTVAEDLFGAPPPGMAYLVIDVTIENLSRDDGAAYSPYYFTVQDSDGFEYDFATYIDPPIRAATLPLGERVRGNVTFALPAAASDLVLSFEPVVIAGGYERLRVALGDMP